MTPIRVALSQMDARVGDLEGNAAKIKRHLDDCSPCLEAYDFEAELRVAIARKCRDSVPETLRIRIHEALLQESQGGPSLPGIPPL